MCNVAVAKTKGGLLSQARKGCPITLLQLGTFCKFRDRATASRLAVVIALALANATPTHHAIPFKNFADQLAVYGMSDELQFYASVESN